MLPIVPKTKNQVLFLIMTVTNLIYVKLSDICLLRLIYTSKINTKFVYESLGIYCVLLFTTEKRVSNKELR